MEEIIDDTNDILEEVDDTEEDVKEIDLESIDEKPTKVNKTIVAICQTCNKPIYDANKIKHVETKKHVGRSTVVNRLMICENCYLKYKQKLKKIEEQKVEDYNKDLKKRLTKSLTLSFLYGLLGIVIGALLGGGLGATLLGIGAFTFSACLYLGNNVVGDVWLSVATWSIHLPGMIFGFDLHGFILFFVFKLAIAILSFVFSIILIILATLVGMIVSIFVYPFALVKNIRKVPDQLR